MPEKAIILEAARFLDSGEARALDLPRASIREIVRRFLICAFDGIGKAPGLLDGGDMRDILAERLPAHFGRRDPLAPRALEVLRAYLHDLEGRAFVAHSFEIHQALEESGSAFQAAVAAGASGARAFPSPRTVVHRAPKVGRNDPCPCGSGKKFKKCCARLGGSPTRSTPPDRS